MNGWARSQVNSIVTSSILLNCSPSQFNTSKDRLLTSEIAEMHVKLQALEKENRELREELLKAGGSSELSRIRSGRKVGYS